MALPATLLTLLVLLGAVLDLVVSAATAVAQLTLFAIGDCMACVSTIEASLFAWWALLGTFRLFSRAADGCDVAFLAALLAFSVFLWAIVTSMVNAATTLALLGCCAIRHCMACLTAVVALLLADWTLLLFADRLVA